MEEGNPELVCNGFKLAVRSMRNYLKLDIILPLVLLWLHEK